MLSIRKRTGSPSALNIRPRSAARSEDNGSRPIGGQQGATTLDN